MGKGSISSQFGILKYVVCWERWRPQLLFSLHTSQQASQPIAKPNSRFFSSFRPYFARDMLFELLQIRTIVFFRSPFNGMWIKKRPHRIDKCSNDECTTFVVFLLSFFIRRHSPSSHSINLLLFPQLGAEDKDNLILLFAFGLTNLYLWSWIVAAAVDKHPARTAREKKKCHRIPQSARYIELFTH